MKNYLKILILIPSLFFSASIFADGPGWTVASKVTKIVVVASGGINVRLSPELSGCTSQYGYGPKYASVYPTHPGLKSIHSNLLTAYASDKEVALYFSDSNCKVGEMVLGGSY